MTCAAMGGRHWIGAWCYGALIGLLLSAATVLGDAPVGGASRPFAMALAEAALELTHQRVRYDGRYMAIAYPNGDVPQDMGVCTDVIVRAYRKLGVDLQQWVHEDMRAHFDQYPSKRIWGLTRPDTNIDHRRVPNLQTFFTRHGQSLTPSADPAHYLSGDMVTWLLPGNLPHIGIVSHLRDELTGVPLIVHNVGAGQVVENYLFAQRITGHYRFAVDLRPDTAE